MECVDLDAEGGRVLEDVLAGVLMRQREGKCQLIVDLEVNLHEVVQLVGQVDALEELALEAMLEGRVLFVKMGICDWLFH